MRWLPQLYPRGTLWSYNNAAFFPAGLLIERLTGKPFARVAREELCAPLGMRDTGYRLSDVLTAASRELCAELRYPAGPDRFTGLTWFTREIDGARLLSHGGSMQCQQSELTIAQERGFAVVVLTNSERGIELNHAVTAAALRAYLDLEAPARDLRPATAEQLAPYAGHYTSVLAGFELQTEGETLWLHTMPKPLEPGAPPPTLRPPARLAPTGLPDVPIGLDPPYA